MEDIHHSTSSSIHIDRLEKDRSMLSIKKEMYRHYKYCLKLFFPIYN